MQTFFVQKNGTCEMVKFQ